MSRLTSGHLIARNTVWSFTANIASMGIALLSVPILLKSIGVSRFGVIGLVWVIEGQFSLFDLGLSRALTKLVAEKLGLARHSDIPSLFWASICLLSLFGLLASITLAGLAPLLAHRLLKVPLEIQPETLKAFYLVAISLPVVISSAGLKGFLEGCQRFDLLSAVRIPISILSYIAPLLILPFSHSLIAVVSVLVAARVLAWSAHLVLCLNVWPELRQKVTFANAPFGRMFRFGGWMTVTNVIGPIMVNLDRFLIGALISMAAVSYYVTPYEAVTKLWIAPSVLSAVLFPAFSTALANDRKEAVALFEHGTKYTFLALFPCVLACLTFGQLGLRLWLGASFAECSTHVLQVLVIGVFVNSLAQIAFWQIQGAGRPDLTAKVHMMELPLYLSVFWVLSRQYGIEGAATAWALRACVDAVLMFVVAQRLLPESAQAIRRLAWMISGAIPFVLIALMLHGSTGSIIFLIAAYVICFGAAWHRLLTPSERAVVRNPLCLLKLSPPELQIPTVTPVQ